MEFKIKKIITSWQPFNYGLKIEKISLQVNSMKVIYPWLFGNCGDFIDYIDTQQSAIFNWFGRVENRKYWKKIDFG